MLSESAEALENLKYRRHSVYGLDLLQLLCVLASAGFVLLPLLSLSSPFERGHPVFIRVHVGALTLLEERQPVPLKCVIIFLPLNDSHTLFLSLLDHHGTLGEIVTGCG